MRSEWPRKHLAEISEVITGFPFKGEKYLPPKHGVRVVRGDNVTERYLRWGEKEKCWSGVTADLKPYVLRSGDVVIGMDGSKVGKNFAAISPDDEGSLLAQRVARLRAREGISQDYLRYVICNDSFTEYVKAVHTGTSIPHISKGQIENFEVVVPPFEDQQQIAAVLISLDDRITLLRETNATLEAIAQALFKSWFVDFDPVRAKMEGRTPEGMDEATAALFPDGFETSELGEVPRGWRQQTFRDTIQIIGGGTPKTSNPDFWGGDIPWFSVVDAPRSSDVFVIDTEKYITDAGLHGSSTKLLPVGTTIISARGTVGKLALTGRAMGMNQSCYGLRGKAGDTYFTYFSATRLVQQLQQRAHGSVFDTITQETFAGIHVAYPQPPVIEAFDVAVSPLMARIRENLFQAQTLSTLRDTLLPRLISGQLRLPEAQAATEAALGGTLSV